MATVYLVDDQAVVRAAFKSWLEESRTFEVIGQNGDARAAIAEIGRLHPDLVLLDIAMPGLSGIEALPLIVDANPDGRVVMVTDLQSEAFVRQAFQGGAQGYLSKGDDPVDLLVGLRRIVGGEQYTSPRARGPGRGDVGGASPGPA